MTTPDTRQTILNVAQAMAQARGYNGLSFRELGKEVGIKSASIHYHFPTKGDLAAALARRYADNAASALDSLAANSRDTAALMKAYTDIFRATLANDNRMCLYGIMTADYDELPVEVRAEVDRFTEVNVRWLVKVLSLPKSGVAKAAAQRRALAIFAAIEGAQLVARGRGEVKIYDEIIESYRTAGLIP